MAGSLLDEAKNQMDSAVEAVRREFNTVRTGKATPTLLDTVRVEAYGSSVPLNQVANVSAPEPNLLMVQPYDQNISEEISRSIQKADLGLNPSVDRGAIRIPVPPLSEERRKEMVKILHRMAEDGRIAVRQARQSVRSQLQNMAQEGEISEDVMHRRMDELQDLTDGHTDAIDDLLERKENEVLSV